MWSYLLSLFRSQPPSDLTAVNQRLKHLDAKLSEIERDLAARTVEFTELANRMAKAAKRASGALGGRPRKDDDDQEQLDAITPALDREARRKRILANIHKPR